MPNALLLVCVAIARTCRERSDTHSAVARNVALTQAEVIAKKWQLAEQGFDTLTEAAANATELLGM